MLQHSPMEAASRTCDGAQALVVDSRAATEVQLPQLRQLCDHSQLATTQQPAEVELQAFQLGQTGKATDV